MEDSRTGTECWSKWSADLEDSELVSRGYQWVRLTRASEVKRRLTDQEDPRWAKDKNSQ